MSPKKCFYISVIVLELAIIATLSFTSLIGMEVGFVENSEITNLWMEEHSKLSCQKDVKLEEVDYYWGNWTKPNVTYYRSYNGPINPIKIRINNHRLRDNDFSKNKPSNVYRILVIGDSFTFGYGLNQSQRYTYRLEKKLEKQYEGNLQVLNAGMGGRGMRDYYKYLKAEGVEFEPDLVIVSFYAGDELYFKKRKKFAENVRKDFYINPEEQNFTEEYYNAMWEKEYSYLTQRRWIDSDIRKYGNKIKELSRRKEFKTVFYQISNSEPREFTFLYPKGLPNKYNSSLDFWSKKCGTNLIHPPNKLSHNSTYTLPENEHYNERGNELLTEKLYKELKNRKLLPQK